VEEFPWLVMDEAEHLSISFFQRQRFMVIFLWGL